MLREDKDMHLSGEGDHRGAKGPIHGVRDRPIHGSPGRPMNGVFLRPTVGFIWGLSWGGFLPPCSVEGGGKGEGASAFWYNFVKEKLIERAKLPHECLRPIATT